METAILTNALTFVGGIVTTWLATRIQKKAQEENQIKSLWDENRKLREDLNKACLTIQELQRQIIQLERKVGI